MKLREFGLLADENVNPAVTRFLRDQGFDVLDAREEALFVVDDVRLIELARQQHRVILTHDRDFGRLALAAMEPVVGILLPAAGPQGSLMDDRYPRGRARARY